MFPETHFNTILYLRLGKSCVIVRAAAFLLTLTCFKKDLVNISTELTLKPYPEDTRIKFKLDLI